MDVGLYLNIVDICSLLKKDFAFILFFITCLLNFSTKTKMMVDLSNDLFVASNYNLKTSIIVDPLSSAADADDAYVGCGPS